LRGFSNGGTRQGNKETFLRNWGCTAVIKGKTEEKKKIALRGRGEFQVFGWRCHGQHIEKKGRPVIYRTIKKRVSGRGAFQGVP